MPEQGFARLKSLYLYGSGGFGSNLVEKTERFSKFSRVSYVALRGQRMPKKKIEELSMIIKKLLSSTYPNDVCLCEKCD